MQVLEFLPPAFQPSLMLLICICKDLKMTSSITLIKSSQPKFMQSKLDCFVCVLMLYCVLIVIVVYLCFFITSPPCKMTPLWRHDACSSLLGTRERFTCWTRVTYLWWKRKMWKGKRSISTRTKNGHANLNSFWAHTNERVCTLKFVWWTGTKR